MVPAPLSFLRRGDPPTRTSLHATNLLTFEDGLSTLEFLPSPLHGIYYMRQTMAPLNKTASGAPSRFGPPPHYHWSQTEKFRVEAGEGTWHLRGGKDVVLRAGEELVVPPKTFHWFEPSATNPEPLVILFAFDPVDLVMEERFFRNAFGYQFDCWAAGSEPSPFQLMVFCWHDKMSVALPVPGPEWFNFGFSTFMACAMGFFGQYVLGYKASYEEYFDEKAVVGVTKKD